MLMEFFRNGNILSNTVSIATSVVSGFANAIIGIVSPYIFCCRRKILGGSSDACFMRSCQKNRLTVSSWSAV